MLLKNCPLCWCTEVGVSDFHDSEVHIESLKWLRSAACVTCRSKRVCKQLRAIPDQELCSCVTRGWAQNTGGYLVTCQLHCCLPWMAMHDASVLYLLVPETAWCRVMCVSVRVCVCPPPPRICEAPLAKEPAFGILL